MAFVIVTHLSPDRKSRLHEVVAHHTSLPVHIVRDGVELEADTVYVMPEGKILTIRDGRLRLGDDDPVHRERKPIDVFFASLAEDQGENAVGIVLSGGDSDGTLGIKAIKERGGITIAQTHNGDGPRNPEMPESALASGLIDFAEPVDRIPGRLLQIRDGIDVVGSLVPGEDERPGSDGAVQAQSRISQLLRSHTGHDFAGYKYRTFMRRVARRMKVVNLHTLDAYVGLLRDDPGEVIALFRDLLINVTSFFRDPGAFLALQEHVMPRLLEGRGADETLRIWVPGCATGEEVYSLAILVREEMDRHDTSPRVQIFATDIDDDTLAVARSARYPEALLTDVDPDRRTRFFRRDGASYAVCKEVRDMCIFSPHSLISDPPFSRMDLVSCRNLLIYLGRDLQDQVIPTFHYALKPGGYLFLGTSEGVSRHGHLFGAVDKQNRIFRSRDHGGGPRRLPMSVDFPGARHVIRDGDHGGFDTDGLHLRQRVELQVLERHAPAHVVVTQDGEILYYSSSTGRYLEMPRGVPNRQLLDLARHELRADLRAALRGSMETGKSAKRHVLMLDHENEAGGTAEVTVEPLGGPRAAEGLFLVLFTPTAERPVAALAGGAEPETHDAERALERELRDMRERLHSTIEEYETALEELKSSNEELVSVNEEAQSTNEELEASKEEMQSLNEELATINGELAANVEELDRANADLKNLYAATEIATIFLDGNLVVRNFTPAAATFFNLLESDLGRPLTDLAGSLHYPDLEAQVREVFATGTSAERRVSSGQNGRHYLVRLAPYRDRDEDVGGVVVTIVDITILAEAEKQQQILISELNHRVKNMLAVVISIANNTRRTAPSPEVFSENLIGRLHGMARAYSLLSRSDWTGVSILELVRAESETFGDNRLTAEGPEVSLAAEQAIAIGMVVHELATNAAKYGALSTDVGHVAVTWKLEDGRVSLRWGESGGPRVAPPAEDGFGLVLIRGQATSQLGGEIDAQFAPDGVVIDLSFPLEA